MGGYEGGMGGYCTCYIGVGTDHTADSRCMDPRTTTNPDGRVVAMIQLCCISIGCGIGIGIGIGSDGTGRVYQCR